MSNRIKSAIILIDNLLSTRVMRYNRKSFAERLEREELPHTDAAITRVLKFIDIEWGINIKTDRAQSVYVIDDDETMSNSYERYCGYRNLYFRNLLQATILDHRIASEYVSFGFGTRNKNVDLLNPLLTTILENRKIRIEYLPFRVSQPSSYIVCPLFLQEYLNRWYLITEKLKEREYNIFAVDRIESYEVLPKRFERTGEVSSEMFRHTIGVSFSEAVERVKLWVSRQQYPYFKTLPIHFSQQDEEEADDGFIISFRVTLNFELRQWLLFFGASVKVIEPQSLRDDMISEIKRNLENYKPEEGEEPKEGE